MTRVTRGANQDLETLMGQVGDFGARSADQIGVAEARNAAPAVRTSRWAGFGTGLAALTSILALAFSGFSFKSHLIKCELHMVAIAP